MKLIKSFQFKNWAGNVMHTIPFFAQPKTELELASLIQSHDKVRVIGSGHSWSDHFSSQQLMLNLDKYNSVLAIDKEAKTITVQSGIKLWELNHVLDINGLALINLGSINKQSIAGAVSTGTHGSGINFSCIADQVLSFSLIKASGAKIILNKGEEQFNAAIIGLGTLGIISEVTLQVTEAFNIHERTFTENFEKVIEKLDEYVYGWDHFKLWWLPNSADVVVYTYKRTNEPVNDSRFRQILNDEIISVLGYRLLVKIGNLHHPWRTPINKFLTKNFDKPLDRIEKGYKVFNVPEPPKHRETEWAFDFKNAKELLKTYRKLFIDSSYTFNFIQEIRFTKSDNFWMSPCYGRDTIWIGAYNHEDAQWPNILADFEQFAIANNGRPHWGKEFNVRKNEIKEMYAKYDEFVSLINSLDPNKKFTNNLINELF
jgi:FAD/FMN-containing dehydrogenase